MRDGAVLAEDAGRAVLELGILGIDVGAAPVALGHVGDRWLVATRAEGVAVVAGGQVVDRWLPSAVLLDLAADATAIWVLEPARGLLRLDPDSGAVREIRPVGALAPARVLAVGPPGVAVAAAQSGRVERSWAGILKVPAPVVRARPARTGALRFVGDTLWLAAPGWGLVEVGPSDWRGVPLTPGALDVVAGPSGDLWVAMGEAGVGRVRDGALVERCEVEGEALRLDRVASGLRVATAEAVIAWER